MLGSLRTGLVVVGYHQHQGPSDAVVLRGMLIPHIATRLHRVLRRGGIPRTVALLQRMLIPRIAARLHRVLCHVGVPRIVAQLHRVLRHGGVPHIVARLRQMLIPRTAARLHRVLRRGGMPCLLLVRRLLVVWYRGSRGLLLLLPLMHHREHRRDGPRRIRTNL